MEWWNTKRNFESYLRPEIRLASFRVVSVVVGVTSPHLLLLVQSAQSSNSASPSHRISHFLSGFQYLHMLLRTAQSAIKRQSSNSIFNIIMMSIFLGITTTATKWIHNSRISMEQKKNDRKICIITRRYVSYF